jgi:hypothetical protein
MTKLAPAAAAVRAHHDNWMKANCGVRIVVKGKAKCSRGLMP